MDEWLTDCLGMAGIIRQKTKKKKPNKTRDIILEFKDFFFVCFIFK